MLPQTKWYQGTIVDYEPKLKKHWIRYDKVDADGSRYYPQNILGTYEGTNWQLL